jgi:hypothetical protein
VNYKYLFAVAAIIGTAVCRAQDPETAKPEWAKWIIKPSGRQIPGREMFETKVPEQTWNTTIDGKSIGVSMWGSELIRKQQGECNSAPIPHFAQMLSRTVRYDEVWAAAIRVRRYTYQNQSFLYEVDAAPCTEDSHSGSIEMIAYYDDDGDGCFETLEYKDTRIPAVEPWRPRLAKWITAPAAKLPSRCRWTKYDPPSKTKSR